MEIDTINGLKESLIELGKIIDRIKYIKKENRQTWESIFEYYNQIQPKSKYNRIIKTREFFFGLIPVIITLIGMLVLENNITTFKIILFFFVSVLFGVGYYFLILKKYLALIEMIRKSTQFTSAVRDFFQFLENNRFNEFFHKTILQMQDEIFRLKDTSVQLKDLIKAEKYHIQYIIRKRENGTVDYPVISLQSSVPSIMNQSEIFTMMLQGELFDKEDLRDSLSRDPIETDRFNEYRKITKINRAISEEWSDIVDKTKENTSMFIQDHKSDFIDDRFMCASRLRQNEITQNPLELIRICHWDKNVLLNKNVISFIEQMELFGVLSLWIEKDKNPRPEFCKKNGNYQCIIEGVEKSDCTRYSDECDFIFFGDRIIRGYKDPAFPRRDEDNVLKFCDNILENLKKKKFYFAKEIAWIYALMDLMEKTNIDPIAEKIYENMMNRYGFRLYLPFPTE
jgi:hypothetical protein